MSKDPLIINHSDQDRIGRYAIDHLDPIANQLEALVAEIFDENSIAYDPESSADQMALAFVTKQREHLRSVRILIDAEAHRDALLIARTMVEGAGSLQWAFLDTPTRTNLWLWYGVIRDLRQLRKNAQDGRPIDEAEIVRLEELADLHGDDYLDRDVRREMRKAQEHGDRYEMPFDPWGNSWTDTNVSDMLSAVGDIETYNHVYRESSAWIHWDPRSILLAMDMGESGVKGFTETDWAMGGLAYPVACRSLLKCLQVLNDHFELGLADRLNDINNQKRAILLEAMASAVFD